MRVSGARLAAFQMSMFGGEGYRLSERFERLISDSTPDELASVLTFTTGRHIESVEALNYWGGAA